MMDDVTAIKKALAQKLHIKTEGRGWELRLLTSPPNGDYLIYLNKKPFCVSIEDDKIHDLRKLK